VTDDEAKSLRAGLEYLSNTMKNEHDAAWRTGVQSILEEMVLAAAGEAIQRSQLARERLYDVMVPSLPPPRERAAAALNGGAYGYLPEDMVDEPYENPRFMQSDLPQHEVGLRND
jgi:hypothetical protein